VIPEIDIWRVANLMLTHYGKEAMLEGHPNARTNSPRMVTTPGRQLGFGSRCNRSARELNAPGDGALKGGPR
jgi:hypothetical protein